MKVKVRDLSKIYQHKGSDTATLLGSGRSINNITDAEWSAIKETDMWTMNNWIYHPFIVPDFYHLELKRYGYPFFKKRMNEKRDLYKNVKFIVPTWGIKTRRPDGTKFRLPLETAIGEHPYIFKYRKPIRRGKPKKCGDANYKIREVPTKSFDASLSIMIELLYKFKYRTVYLYGLDMNDSFYFWSGGDPIYGDVHHQTNKAHENKDPKLPHSAAHMKSFVVDFNNRWFKPDENREMYVGHKDTSLWPGIEYRSII